jgi:hypothetical protein
VNADNAVTADNTGNAGPSAGRDRLSAIAYVRILHLAGRRATADPRDQLFSEPTTDQTRTSTYSDDTDLFAAREDPTSPCELENTRKTAGYVGQAARPPTSGGQLVKLTRIASCRSVPGVTQHGY